MSSRQLTATTATSLSSVSPVSEATRHQRAIAIVAAMNADMALTECYSRLQHLKASDVLDTLEEFATEWLPLIPPSAHRTTLLAQIRRVTGKLGYLPRDVDAIIAAHTPADPRQPGSFDHSSILRFSDPQRIALEHQYFIDKWLPRGQVGEIIGGYGMLKTWLLLALLLSVAFGVPFFGRSVQRAPAFLLAYEGGSGIWLRVAAWLVHHNLLPPLFTRAELAEVVRGHFNVAEFPPTFVHGQFETGLRATIDSLGGACAIGIDTFGKAMGPDQSENDADDSHQIVAMLTRICGDSSTILFTRHTGHAATDRGRGSAAISQDVDFSFLIKGDRADAAAGRGVSAEPIKRRNDEYPPPLDFRLERVTFTLDGVEHQSAVVVQAEPNNSQSLRAQVFKFVMENPGSGTRDIYAAVVGSKPAVKAELDHLKMCGAVRVTPVGAKHTHSVAPGYSVQPNGAIVGAQDDFTSTDDGNVSLDDIASPAATEEAL